MYQNVTENKLISFKETFEKFSNPYTLELISNSSKTDTVEGMNKLYQERQNLGENCITIKIFLKLKA